MKKYILYAIVLFFPVFLMGQTRLEKKGYIKFGTGLYFDLSGLHNYNTYKDPYTGLSPQAVVLGKTLWIEAGYKLNNGLMLSGEVMYELTKPKNTDILYNGKKKTVFESNYSVLVGYEFKTSRVTRLFPEIGLTYNRYTTEWADYGLYMVDNEHVVVNPHFYNQVDTDIGISVHLDYYFKFKNNLFLGVRTGGIYLLGIGILEGAVLTPVLGVNF